MILTSGTAVVSHSLEETLSLGRDLADRILPGQVVALLGELGTGKTSLVQGLCTGWGVREYVNSPTFTYINIYHGRIPVCHCDLYRVSSPEGFSSLGVDAYLEAGYVCCIEWADHVPDLLRSADVIIYFRCGEDMERDRIIRVEWTHATGH